MGLVRSAQAFLATVLGLARTRLELLSVEMQELLVRLVLLMVAAVAAILLAALALGFGAVAIVIAAPPEYRVAVCVALAVALLAAAALIGRHVWRASRLRPFLASLAELEADGEALEPRE